MADTWWCNFTSGLGAAGSCFDLLVAISGLVKSFARVRKIGRQQRPLIAYIRVSKVAGKITHEKRHAHCYENKPGTALVAYQRDGHDSAERFTGLSESRTC